MAATDPLRPLLDLPGVSEAADSARQAVDRLLRHRVLRRGGEEVSAESALRGARASAALDGVEVPLDVLRAGGPGAGAGGAGGGAGSTAGTAADPVVQAALRVSAGVGPLVGTWERAPAQALARLHVLAAAGREPDAALGRPSGHEAAVRISGLTRILTQGGDAPAVVLAAVVHAELLATTPFPVGSGLVARAAARLTLAARGLDRRLVSVPEVGHLELCAEYRSALADYATGGPDGVARWIRHCCAAVTLGATEGLAVCEALLRG